ncbi:PREDICTED: serpin B13-like [Vollenhovia emeryi]|uniref:serpin B13-like n=1 Tax=Vollenhovia emeryi TaxID=411798 RepID=UPI0005F56CF8|nr:PREDICTED: serpin B13-like [Vollenhovia emeryi]
MLTEARFKFALESLKMCILTEPKNNIFFSPHLVYHNLLVVYFGVSDDGDDELTLEKALYIPSDLSKADVEQQYVLGGIKQFCYALNKPASSYTCRIFGRILISEKREIFLRTLNLFETEHFAKEVNFNYRPHITRDFVNNCVAVLSQRHIKEMLPPDSIDENTDLILFNVIYVQSELDCNFELNTTPDASVRKRIKNKKTKNSTDTNLNNGKSERLDAYITELPCNEKKISTFFIYPSCHSESVKDKSTESDRIAQLIKRLTTEEGSRELRRLMDVGLEQQTDMRFPVFNVELSFDMKRLLDMLGLQKFMSSNMGELHEFSSHSLSIGTAIHRVKIELTRTSLTATASNAFITDDLCEYNAINVSDIETRSSCICLIYDRLYRNILFCGTILGS